MNMLGLALEGGGAKGSFQAGLMRALLDHGYVFDGAVGSSIGALNAAMLVQGDFEKSYDMEQYGVFETFRFRGRIC